MVCTSYNLHSRFVQRSTQEFWEIFGSEESEVKKATIVIPVSREQKMLLDSISGTYTAAAPYDYAFIGMRCGAAAYDVLARLVIMRKYPHRRTYMKVFYPRKLRRRLLKIAAENNWAVYRQEGVSSRKWEAE